MKPFSQNMTVLLWSSFLALMAGLLLRFMHVLLTSLLLRFFSIGFNFHLFRISYEGAAGGQWSDVRVLSVYLLGTLVFLFLGVMAYQLTETSKIKNLKIRLFFTWFSFLAVFLFPLQALSGVFIHDEMGLGLRWFIPGWVFRLIVAIVLVGAGFLFRVVWIKLFLKTAWALEVIDSYGKRKKHIRLIFFQSLLIAALIMTLFGISTGSLTWIVMNISLALVGLAFVVLDLPEKTPRIVKTEDAFRLSMPQFIWMLAVLMVLFGLGFL
jgi:hypothetical protein